MLVAIILSILATLAGAGFLFWFIIRTPHNLREWYGLPVTIAVIGFVILVWLLAVVL